MDPTEADLSDRFTDDDERLQKVRPLRSMLSRSWRCICALKPQSLNHPLSVFPPLGSENHRRQQKGPIWSGREGAPTYSGGREDSPDRRRHVRHHDPSWQYAS